MSTLNINNNQSQLFTKSLLCILWGNLHRLFHLIPKHISKVDIQISISHMRKCAQGHTATKGYSKDLNTIASKQHLSWLIHNPSSWAASRLEVQVCEISSSPAWHSRHSCTQLCTQLLSSFLSGTLVCTFSFTDSTVVVDRSVWVIHWGLVCLYMHFTHCLSTYIWFLYRGLNAYVFIWLANLPLVCLFLFFDLKYF